jgi:hypothetical protein
MSNPSTFVLVFYGLPFALVIITVVWRIRFNFKEKRFMQAAAAALGFTYEQALMASPTLGNFFLHGGSFLNVISGERNSIPTRAFDYRFTVGSGKNRHTEYYTIFETTYPYALPHIILKPRTFIDIEIAPFGTHLEPLKLEGDFSKYFDLFAEKNLEVDIYEIFTPDIMTDFIDKIKGLHFETFGQHLYLIKKGWVSRQNDFNQLMDATDFISTSLLPHFKETSADTATMETLDKNPTALTS